MLRKNLDFPVLHKDNGIVFVGNGLVSCEKVDDRQSYGETRIAAIGAVDGVAIFMAYTIRGGRYRIISARREQVEMSEERIIRRSSSDLRTGKTDWARLKALTEEEIDEAARSDPDAQPTDDEFWKGAALVMPETKQPVSIRLDRDVLDWFRKDGRGYQTRMNAVLRSYMNANRE